MTGIETIIVTIKTLFFAFLAKGAMAIKSFILAFIATALRYIKLRREGVVPKLKEFAAFCALAWLVTYTGLAGLDYFGYELDQFGQACLIWVGMSADYFYEAIPDGIKSFFNKKLNLKK